MKIGTASLMMAMLLAMTPSSRPAASEFLYKLPCTVEIFADHQPSVYTDCVIRSSMAQGAYYATITLPDGRKFRVENAGSATRVSTSPAGPDPSEIWFLNGKRAQKTGTEAKPCYQNASAKICLE